jgi:hypothetical protein
VLGWLLNDFPIFIKLGGIIKFVDVYAETETEIISNFVIKNSVCINIVTWFNDIFPIGNQEYLPFIIDMLIEKFILPRLFM